MNPQKLVSAYYATKHSTTIAEFCKNNDVAYSTFCRWLNKGAPQKNGRPYGMSAPAEDIVEAVIRGWACSGLPLLPCEVLTIASTVSRVIDDKNKTFSYSWLYGFEKRRSLQRQISHKLTRERAAVMTEHHADQLQEEYLKCLQLIGFDQNDPSFNYRIYACDETDTFKRWDKEESEAVRPMHVLVVFVMYRRNYLTSSMYRLCLEMHKQQQRWRHNKLV